MSVGTCLQINNDLAGAHNLIKMSLELFHKVPAGAIETLFDEQNQPLFKRGNLGKYSGIEDIRHNLKDFPSHYTHPRLNLKGGRLIYSLGRTKNPHVIFINLDGSIEMAVLSKKPKAVALVKWLTKKGVEKDQEEHQQAITGRDKQIQSLELKNEEYQQKILSLNKETDDLIANRHVTRRGCFDNVLCFIKRNGGDGHPYYVIRCQYRQLEKHKRWLKLRYPNMKVVENVVIQTPSTSGIGSSEKLSRLLQKSFQPDQGKARTS